MSEVGAEFIREIRSGYIREPKTFEIDGVTYCTEDLTQVTPDAPAEFPKITLNSLDGVADYITENKDSYDTKDCQIVCTHASVDIVSPPLGDERRRDVLVTAVSGSVFDGLNKWMDPESFRIWTMTQFKGTKDMESLLLLLSKIVDENIQISEDNGIAQTVTARVGIAPSSGVVVPSPLDLEPIRTFEEVDQPIGKFVVRLRKAAVGKGIEIALFEVLTNWKRTAALAVRDYLKEKLPDMTVLA